MLNILNFFDAAFKSTFKSPVRLFRENWIFPVVFCALGIGLYWYRPTIVLSEILEVPPQLIIGRVLQLFTILLMVAFVMKAAVTGTNKKPTLLELGEYVVRSLIVGVLAVFPLAVAEGLLIQYPGMPPVAQTVMTFAACMWIFYVCVKTAFYIPSRFAGKKGLSFFDAWKKTNGLFWQIAAYFVLLSVTAMFIMIITYFVLGSIFGLIGSSVNVMTGSWMLVLWSAESVVSACLLFFCGSFSAAAAAMLYNGALKKEPAQAAVKAPAKKKAKK